MKAFNNISARDRNLLILLLAAIIFYLSYTFVLTPGIEKSGLLNGDIAATQDEIARAKELIENRNDLARQENKLRKDLVDKYAVFFTNLDQVELLHKLDTLMTGTGIKANSYMASILTVSSVELEQGGFAPLNYPMLDLAKNIEPKLYEGEPSEQLAITAGQEGDTPDRIPCMEIIINYNTTSYDSVYNFIYSLEQLKKTVIVKSIDYTKQEGYLEGQLILDFYSIPQFDTTQNDGLTFVPVIPQGKANPFS